MKKKKKEENTKELGERIDLLRKIYRERESKIERLKGKEQQVREQLIELGLKTDDDISEETKKTEEEIYIESKELKKLLSDIERKYDI